MTTIRKTQVSAISGKRKVQWKNNRRIMTGSTVVTLKLETFSSFRK